MLESVGVGQFSVQILAVFQAILNGMDSIQKVMQYFADNRKYPEVQRGYYGTLIENFECDKTFFTSVEVTAGGRWVLHDVKNVD